MHISRRLNRLAGLVTEGNRLADVGTDHGYVPITLCLEGKIPSAIAMDINRGPLERAQAHIVEAGLCDRIETRCSDGLAKLKGGEADTVLIAGMGGRLVARILTDGAEALQGVGELILQPQSDIALVRGWLGRNGWRITLEDILGEDGKYYPLFRAEPGEEEEALTREELSFGRLSLQRSPEVLAAYLDWQIRVHEEIRNNLPEQETERAREQRAQLEDRLTLLQSVRRNLV